MLFDSYLLFLCWYYLIQSVHNLFDSIAIDQLNLNMICILQDYYLQFLQMLLITRRDINTEGMICNNWHVGKSYSQRGLRCNICNIAEEKTKSGQIYMSAHCNGAALDYDVPGKTAEQVRQRILKNADKFPFKIRLESNVNWVHQDIYDDINSSSKISLF